MNRADRYVYSLPGTPVSVQGRVFLNRALGLSGAEISINKMPPAQGVPFLHRHAANEEIYLFLAGQGEFQVDGSIFPVGEGSVVRVSPEGERCWRNTGPSDLLSVVVQARAGSYEGQAPADGTLVRKPVSWAGSPASEESP